MERTPERNLENDPWGCVVQGGEARGWMEGFFEWDSVLGKGQGWG